MKIVSILGSFNLDHIFFGFITVQCYILSKNKVLYSCLAKFLFHFNVMLCGVRLVVTNVYVMRLIFGEG